MKKILEILEEKKSFFKVVRGKGSKAKIRLPWFNYDKCL